MTPPESAAVGFIGTGAMGREMALRVLAAGHELVVHNRTRGNANAVEQAGGSWAASPTEVAERCDIVLSCLRDSHAVEEVYLGPGGVVASVRPGGVLVEHGTFSPGLAQKIRSAALAEGAEFLDAPVTGGPDGARAGKLAVMVGGDPAAVARVEAIVASYAAAVVRVGESGSGLSLKLVNQLLTSTHMAVSGEAIALLQRVGVNLHPAAAVLTRGWAGSAMLGRALDHIATNQLDETGATIVGMLEVQELVAEMLAAHAVPSPVFDAAHQTFDRAVASGAGHRDPAAFADLFVNEETR